MDILIAPSVTAYLYQSWALLATYEHVPEKMFRVAVGAHVEEHTMLSRIEN